MSAFHFRRDRDKYRTNCKTCRNTGEAARRYNITVDEVLLMKEAQGNACAICRIPVDEISHASFKTSPLVIDHAHATGQVRGLLCPTCNSGLGHFKDDERLLTAAALYIASSR